MIINKIVGATLIGVKIGISTMFGYGANEIVVCNVESLEEHDFIQLSDNKEYVCINENDFTDFIILEDRYDEFRINDTVKVELNRHNKIVDYEVVAFGDE